MLAAVGVLLGTFIASAFGSKFNEDLFASGMYTYAVYVLLFPLFAGLVYSQMGTRRGLSNRNASGSVRPLQGQG